MMTNSMINFEEKFNELQDEFSGKQKKILVNSALKVYYGITKDGYLRISFMSTIKPLNLESTKDLKISLGQESEDVYWICFDLLNPNASKVFYSFCEDLVEAVTNKFDETEALVELKNRYYAWKMMFKNKKQMSSESNQGLYGELYFMDKYMLERYNAIDVIKAWVGPNKFSKDFSINDDWFEVKTISSSSSTIKISSISQLSSLTPGNLVVVKVDRMSDKYEDGYSDIYDLFQSIMFKIADNETKEVFIEKLIKYGFDFENNSNMEKYKFMNISFYSVDDAFPRLKESDIKYQEIGKITYELILNTLDKYKKDI